MRYSEIITEQQLLEKISLGTVGRKLRQQILALLPDHIHRYYKQAYKQMPFYHTYTTQADTREDPAPGIELVKKWIGTFLKDQMSRVMNQQTAGRAGYGSAFFDELPSNTAGRWSVPNIKISQSYLDELATVIYHQLSDSFGDTGGEIIKLDMSNYGISGKINTIVSIFVHELTHALQTSSAGRDDTYRSYMVKSKKQFWEIMRRSTGDLFKNKVYLSSPEEIGAFAQNTAYDMIKEVLDDEPEWQVIYITDLIKNLSLSITPYRTFIGEVGPIAKKVVQRFLKRVYQELDDSRDTILRDHLAEIKQKKAKEEYDTWVDNLDVNAPNFDELFMAGPPKKSQRAAK